MRPYQTSRAIIQAPVHRVQPVVPDLPTELWLEIQSLLPHIYVNKMMGMSRTLFGIALERIYRHVELDFAYRGRHLTGMDTDGNLRFTLNLVQLRHVNVAQHVRSLEVRRMYFAPPEETSMFSLRVGTSLENFLPCLVKGKKPLYECNSIFGRLKLAEETIPHLTAVEHLAFVLYNTARPGPSFTSLIRTIWNTMDFRLRSLALNVTLPELYLILIPALTHNFPNLSILHLSMSALGCSRRNGRQILKNTLPVFMKLLQSSLQSLQLTSSSLTKLYPLLSGLDHFPHLRKLHVFFAGWNIDLRECSSLISFLAQHRQTLEDLRLRIEPTSADPYFFYFHAEFCKLNFTRLHTLHLGCFPPGFAVEDILKDDTPVFPLLPELVSFVMVDVPLDTVPQRLTRALDHLSHAPKLRRVELKVDHLSPRLMDSLASHLPQLAELDLMFSFYGRPYTGSSTDAEQHNVFCRQMRGRRYPNWYLRYLRISSVNSSSCGHRDLSCMQAVAACLPSSPRLGEVRSGCCGKSVCRPSIIFL